MMSTFEAQTKRANAALPKIYFSMLMVPLTLLAACAAPPAEPLPMQSVVVSRLNDTPQLQRFNHFEMELQGSGTSNVELKTSGSLNFKEIGAAFDVATSDVGNAGRLFVQPDACRDDPSDACARRFVISGRLNVFKTTVNCYISVINDTALGYEGQSLTGLCQDRNSRGYGITLFSK